MRLFNFVMLIGALVALGGKGMISSDRTPSSVTFPRHQATSNLGDVLDRYTDYLTFVLAIGKTTDAATAKRLEKTFEVLRERDKTSAARFLRGLRFEMVQKLELLGWSEAQVSSDNPVIRKWVAKFLPVWTREADEYLFRAKTASIAKK